MVQLITLKFTFKNSKLHVQPIFFLQVKRSQYAITSCCQPWEHFQNVFVGMLGSINDLRTIQLSNPYQRPTHKIEFNLRSWAIKVILCYPSSWSPINKMLMWSIPFWNFFSTDTFLRVGVLLKMHLGFWKRNFKNYYWKTTF